jgi:hypothetical protein
MLDETRIVDCGLWIVALWVSLEELNNFKNDQENLRRDHALYSWFYYWINPTSYGQPCKAMFVEKSNNCFFFFCFFQQPSAHLSPLDLVLRTRT